MLSWSIVFVALLTVAAAHAEDLGSNDSRHQVGIQAGGSGFFQIAYRYRFLGPVHLDVGALGAPPDAAIGNFSLGLVFAARNTARLSPYAGFGVGFALFEGLASGCDPNKSDCPTVGDTVLFGYGRVGLALAFDTARRHTLGLDVGAWYGDHKSMKVEGTSTTVTTTRTTILWPMAGLSYFYAFRP